MKEWEKDVRAGKRIVRRLNNIKNDVLDWKHPTDEHHDFKTFMRNILDDVLKQCTRPLLRPEKKYYVKSRLDEIKDLEKDIIQEKRWCDSIRNNIKVNKKWLADLRESVPQPKGNKQK